MGALRCQCAHAMLATAPQQHALLQKSTSLLNMHRAPLDWAEQTTTGWSDLILVNSNFTAGVFGSTFARLVARGIKPAVLYPAVPVPTQVGAGSSKEGIEV